MPVQNSPWDSEGFYYRKEEPLYGHLLAIQTRLSWLPQIHYLFLRRAGFCSFVKKNPTQQWNVNALSSVRARPYRWRNAAKVERVLIGRSWDAAAPCQNRVNKSPLVFWEYKTACCCPRVCPHLLEKTICPEKQAHTIQFLAGSFQLFYLMRNGTSDGWGAGV